MNPLRREAPPELDISEPEIDMPLSVHTVHTLEQRREDKSKALRESIRYLLDVLDMGVRGR